MLVEKINKNNKKAYRADEFDAGFIGRLKGYYIDGQPDPIGIVIGPVGFENPTKLFVILTGADRGRTFLAHTVSIEEVDKGTELVFE